jgi:PAS domain S-box-containing protein/putative nucleotidyltransferase with HDIG domain
MLKDHEKSKSQLISELKQARETIFLLQEELSSYQKAEQALRDKEASLRMLYENMPVGVAQISLDSQFVNANQAYCQMLGYHKEELIGKHFREITHPEIVDENLRKQSQLASGERDHYRMEKQLVHKSGQVVHGILDANLIRDAQGKPCFCLGSVVDVTEHKLADIALCKRFKELKCMYAISQDIQQDLSIEDICQRAVEHLVKAMQFPKIAVPVIELNGNRFTTQDDTHSLSHSIHSEIQSEGQIQGHLWVYYTQDQLFLIPEEQNLIKAIAETLGSCFAHKRLEQALRHSEEKYKKLFNSSPDGLALVDANGKFLTVNKAMAETFGMTPQEIEGQTHQDLMPLDLAAQRTEKLQQALEKGEPVLFEDKREGYYFQNYYVPMNESDNTMTCQVISRNITSRKKAQKELKKTLNKLNQTIRGTFLALSLALEQRDAYTAGHQEQVSILACAIARKMGLDDDRIQGLYFAGMVHDIGKIAVPAEILAKPTKLTPIELGLIRQHAQTGYDILKDIDFPWPIADIVYQHHERINGSGYPQGLTEDKILLESKILAVADVVEAMTSHRPYRPGLGIEVALQEIEMNKGVLYDKTASEICLHLFRENKFSF